MQAAPSSGISYKFFWARPLSFVIMSLRSLSMRMKKIYLRRSTIHQSWYWRTFWLQVKRRAICETAESSTTYSKACLNWSNRMMISRSISALKTSLFLSMPITRLRWRCKISMVTYSSTYSASKIISIRVPWRRSQSRRPLNFSAASATWPKRTSAIRIWMAWRCS